jgi:hypothetical protein
VSYLAEPMYGRVHVAHTSSCSTLIPRRLRDLCERGLADLLAGFLLRVGGLADAETLGYLGLREAQVFAPGAHGCGAVPVE